MIQLVLANLEDCGLDTLLFFAARIYCYHAGPHWCISAPHLKYTTS